MNKDDTDKSENKALLELVGLAKKDKEAGHVISSDEFKNKLANRNAELIKGHSDE